MASAMKMRSENVTPINLHKWSYFIENEFCLDREGVLDHEVCARSHITAPIFHGVAMKVMAARATRISRVYVDVLDRGALDPDPHARSQVRSIAQTGTPCFFSTFYSTLIVRTYNKRKH